MTGTTLDTPNNPPNDPHRLLGQFLRARREAAVADASLGEGRGRRRTPGLRREEVAQRAGISTTWYTWLEQGRDVALSADALARLAEGLGLSVAERGYLFELARRRDPSPHGRDDAMAAALLRTVAALPMPAYALDRHWCRRAWNAPAAELFAAWGDSGEDNLLRFVFLVPTARMLIRDWDERARRVVAEFRADTALYPDDAILAGLVDALCRGSADFARYWNAQDVLGREGGQRAFDHPRQGRVTYTQVTLVPAGHTDSKLVLLLPDGSGHIS